MANHYTKQQRMIINYMRSYGEITQREAFFMGVYRLSAVIYEIKKSMPIRSEWRVVTNIDGSKSRVAFYSIIDFSKLQNNS